MRQRSASPQVAGEVLTTYEDALAVPGSGPRRARLSPSASPRRRPAASAVPAASVARSARRRVRGRRQAATDRSARRLEGEPPPAAASPSTARSACPVPVVTGFRRGGSARRDSACRPRRRSPLSPLSSPRPPPECWDHSSPMALSLLVRAEAWRAIIRASLPCVASLP